MQKPILIYTVHKCASMFIYKIAGELCSKKGMRLYSVNAPQRGKFKDWLSRIGILAQALKIHKENETYLEPVRNCSTLQKVEGCIAPIRVYAEPEKIDAYEIILHLRDPRDVLVSEYFSVTYSHPRRVGGFNPSDEQRQQWKNMGIEEFILGEWKKNGGKTVAEEYLQKYESYCEKLVGRSNVVFVKYEEMVLDFRSWLSKFIAPFHFHNEKEIIENTWRKYRDEFDIPVEDVYKHKRQIMPGDYIRKLTPTTTAKLNKMFAGPLQTLGYENRQES